MMKKVTAKNFLSLFVVLSVFVLFIPGGQVLAQSSTPQTLVIASNPYVNQQFGSYPANQSLSQSFVAPPGTITSVQLNLTKWSNPTYPITFSLKDGLMGNVLYSSTISPSQVSSFYSYTASPISISIPPLPSIVAGNVYYLNISVATVDSSNYYFWPLDNSTPYANGMFYLGTNGVSYADANASITYLPGSSTAPITYPITVTQGTNGAISPAATSVPSGGSQTFTITPNSGYQIASVTVDGTAVTPVPTMYIFSNVTASHTITAAFNPLTYTINASNVTGTGGTISPSGPAVYNQGSSATYTITADPGYQIASITVDGKPITPVPSSPGSYTFNNISSSHLIGVAFFPAYPLTVTQSANGNISPATASVTSGGSQTFTITPNFGYRISSVTVDGTSVGTVSSYTFSNVTAAHTITAGFTLVSTKFSLNDRVQVTSGPLNVRSTPNVAGTILGTQATGALGTVVGGPIAQGGYIWWNVNYTNGVNGWSVENYLRKYIPPYYLITVTQGTNGAISPFSTYVVSGTSQTFTITPNSGYQTTSVTVDGVSVGVISSYTFPNVTAAHTITATFSIQNTFVQNLFRNATFNRTTNPGKPDFFGVDEVGLSGVQDIGSKYGIDTTVTPPVPGVKVLKMDNSSAFPYFRVIPYRFMTPLPNGPYTYSIYLKSPNATPTSPAGYRFSIWPDSALQNGTLTDGNWKRIILPFTVNGSNPNPWFWVNGPAIYYIAAPMLESGSVAHDFVPAPEDSLPDPTPLIHQIIATTTKMFVAFQYNYYTSETVDPTVQLRVESRYANNVDIHVSATNNGIPLALTLAPITLTPNSHQIVSIPNSLLLLGKNVFTVEAWQNGVKIASFAKVLPKKTPGAFEVRIDNFKKGFRVNGSDFYPIGLHLNFPVPNSWLLDEVVARHMNVLYYVPILTPDGSAFDTVAATAYINAVQSRGFKVIMGLVMAGGRPSDWTTTLQKFTTFMNAMKGNTNILAWYPVDEPDSGSWTEANLQTVYDAVLATDPYRPCIINESSSPTLIGNQPFGSFSSTDIFSESLYALAFLRPNSNNSLHNFAIYSQAVGETDHLFGLSGNAWTQIYGYGDAWREPTPDELRFMSYINLLYGTHLSYFSTKSIHQPTWDALGVITNEMNTIATSIFQDPNSQEMETGTISGNIYYSVWKKGSTLYVIAVNSVPLSSNLSIDLSSYGTVSSASELFPGGGNLVSGNTVSESFPPYQSRVWMVTLK